MNYALKYINSGSSQQKAFLKKPLLINQTYQDLVFNNFFRKTLSVL